MNKVKEYIEELNTIDEHVRIEAKQCTDRIDKSVLESVCSFSNEPGLNGGVILIGLQESHDASCPYKVIGVTDADKLQRDLASQCATMFNHPVRPFIESEIINGKTVIMVTVSELDQRYKPLYFEKESLPRGAWRRIGSTDQRCNEEDLSVFYHDTDGFDKAIAEDTDLEDIDENAVRRYRQLRETVNSNAEELNYSDIDLLRSLKAISKDKDGNWRLTNTVFHETQLAEAKGTGIGTMRKLMKEAGMMPPTFESDHSRNLFTTRILLHHLLSEDDLNWFSSVGMDDLSDGQKTVLVFLREVGAIDNITYRQLTGLSSRAASRELKQLEKSGAILMKGLGRNAYYIPSAKLTALYFVKDGSSIPNDGTSVPNDGTSVPNDGSSIPNDGTSCGGDAIPIALKERIEQIGLRVPKEVLADIIIELCRVKPFSGEELAGMLGRSEAHIKNRILPNLIDNGRLKFIYPEMINHPNQKYTAK